MKFTPIVRKDREMSFNPQERGREKRGSEGKKRRDFLALLRENGGRRGGGEREEDEREIVALFVIKPRTKIFFLPLLLGNG